MYCSNCGKADQAPETYCRACGQYLRNPEGGALAAFGGRTPQENITAINVLSVIAALASVVVGVLMYLTRFNEPIILYLAAALLLCNAVWHVSNLIAGMKLRRRLSQRSSTPNESEQLPRQGELPVADTHDLLPVGDPAVPLPLSVVEDTTRNLGEKVPRD